ncbi:hypothetical protein [Dyadobacter sandarakinus]|uniref:mRNA-degrading endonuclease RelE, toxin component of the RelBE toxin-antitoxin system n=1 Tax=Dyadobacter sandarakinus TaxID=2747268 RepID=A0ABX7IDZ6_9BACT|nr:hypothetical protein [Dyadobacter sandarakinus]QRR03333.1 hypothetical protein HWI92_21635 [Dyadobacter sandarakinus]
MFEVRASGTFQKEAKKLIKKYSSLKEELSELGNALALNPIVGTPLGRNCYKVRLSIKSKGKGKSGGARVITCVLVAKEEVILLTIYDKQVRPDLGPNELEKLLSDVAP